MEVHDSAGALVPANVGVKFANIFSGGTAEAKVSYTAASALKDTLVSPTDAAGRVQIFVKLSTKAGSGRVVVSALGFVDTVSFAISPGKAMTLDVTPSEKTVYQAGSFTLSAVVKDAYQNVRTDSVVYSAGANHSSFAVSPDGAVTALSIGRFILTASAGGLTTNIGVSTVPKFRVAGWTWLQTKVVSMELDGSDSRMLTSAVNGGLGPHTVWLPGTDQILYADPVSSVMRIFKVTDPGAVKTQFLEPVATMTHNARPSASLDGSTVYFMAWDSRCSNAQDYCLFKSTATGTQVQLVTAMTAYQPSSSPDGSSVAFATPTTFGTVRVFNSATGLAAWSVTGNNPAWAPNGQLIAFVDEYKRVNLISPGGFNRVVLADSPVMDPQIAGYAGPLAWSPDGNWLAARYMDEKFAERWALIRVANGEVLPLTYSSYIYIVALK